MTFEEKLAQAFKETFDERTERLMKIEKKHRFSLAYRLWERKTLWDISRGRRNKLWTLRKAKYFVTAMTAAFSLLIGGTAFAAIAMIGRYGFENNIDYSKVLMEAHPSDKTTLEEYYGLPEEDGWVIDDFSASNYASMINYTRGDESIIYKQEVIHGNMGLVNTENAVVEAMSIYEENDGFFIRFKHGECGLWWIYDGYLFSIAGNLDKSELANLAYSTKIVKF